MHADSRSEDVDHHGAGATRQDDVGRALGGLNELLVHGFHKGLVVTQHVLPGTATLSDVATNDAHQALVTVGIHKHLDIHTLTQLFINQHHDTFHNNDLGGMHINHLLRTGTSDVGVDRHGNGLTLFQAVEVVDEQVPLDGIRVVEVDLLLLFCEMTDTEFSGSWLTSSLTTVVFPEPEPPAIPMTNIILWF